MVWYSHLFKNFSQFALVYTVKGPKSLQMVIAAMKLKDLLLRRKVMTNLDSILKRRDITLPTKVYLVKPMYGFSSGQPRVLQLIELQRVGHN